MPPDYLVKLSTTPAAADAKPITVERLVRAKSQAQAVGHVVADTVTVSLAETEDIMRLASTGVVLEKAAE